LATFVDYGPFDIPGIGSRSVKVYRPDHHGRAALYLFDGQNVFGDEGSYAGGWFAHQAVDGLPASLNRPIVVAIPNGGTARMAELIPWEGTWGGGKADAFIDWIADGLMPRIVADHGLTPGSIGAVIGGSSLGGLASLYAHFKRPDAFGGALCMSSSLFIARGAVFPFVAEKPIPMYSRIYLDCGEHEGRMVDVSRRMAETLRGRGYTDDRLRFRADKRGTHNEKHWRRRLPLALRFLFRH
jgi:predicted alpha/beta superfamily hydrolase